MTTDTKSAQFVRGLVRTIFIGCYAAFMWASIHHVAAFFDNFEQNSAGSSFGSYLLAGAIDITALVTTIGVMFFRKSMPKKIQVILWVFIIGLALYSFFINWEYASHYQNTSLTLQPTGETTPLLDKAGNVHYVPVMTQELWLLYVNPVLASCFTIFALIYSVVGEFFGTKAPSADELTERLKHLQATTGIQEQIKELENKGKGPSWITRGKQAALELKGAVKEVTQRDEQHDETEQANGETPAESTEQAERNTDKLTRVKRQQAAQQATDVNEETEATEPRFTDLSEEESIIATYRPKSVSWLSTGASTVSIKAVSETMNLSMKLLRNRVASHAIRATKNKEIVYKSSVIAWALSELIPIENQKTIRMKAVNAQQANSESSNGNAADSNGNVGMVEQAMLQAIRTSTEEEQAELRQLSDTKTLAELTSILQERYPKYAGYITESRVATVAAILQEEQQAPA